MNETHHDDLDGIWAAHRRGYPDATLVIVHPNFIDDVTYVAAMALQDEWELPELRGNATAHDVPSKNFARDWSIAAPTYRDEVSVGRYGELLNVALSQIAALEDADPEDLDRMQALAQNVADHTMGVPLLQNLESSVLSYLSARLWQEQVEGMWRVALFGPSDPWFRQHVAEDRTVAGRDEHATSEFLRVALRSICMNAQGLFEELHFEDETLSWLGLDNLVDERTGIPTTCPSCATVNDQHARFCAECGNRLATQELG